MVIDAFTAYFGEEQNRRIVERLTKQVIIRDAEIDHWHRTESDPERPYAFKDANTLLQDFFREVRRVLAERGISETVVEVEETKR